MNRSAPPPSDNSISVEDQLKNQLLRIDTVPKPPTQKQIVQNLGKSRKDLDDLIMNYRKQLQAYRDERPQKSGEDAPILTVNERIVDDALGRNMALLNPKREELMKMRREELVGFFDRFDWRTYDVVPPVRDQHPNQSCWAYAATEALESSLMIQRSNFATDRDGNVWIEQIALNVYSTSDCVPPKSSNSPGRHENPFNYYLMVGIPRDEIVINGISLDDEKAGDLTAENMMAMFENRDPKLDECHCLAEEKDRVKAVGWDYVHSELQGDPPAAHPWEIPELDEMKKALLEHGPLVIAINSDQPFQRYGVKLRGNGTPIGNHTPIYKADPQLDFNHFVLLIGWDDNKSAWIIQNTYGTKWGIACDFEGSLQGGEDFVEDYETTGGYAYVAYNTIGQFAAWVEAPLLEQGLEKKGSTHLPNDNLTSSTND